jgi:hypothetical protein
MYCSPTGEYQQEKPAGVEFKPLGIIALADAIPGMRALSIANVMGNRIGKDHLSKLQEIMRFKPNLISLCGIADDATEADLSGLNMDADDAIILATELPDKGALTSLDLSDNKLGTLTSPGGWSSTPGDGLKYRHSDGRCQNNKPEGEEFKPGGIIAIGNAIPDMGALTSLNLADNRLCGIWTSAYGRAKGTFDSSGMFSVHACFNDD